MEMLAVCVYVYVCVVTHIEFKHNEGACGAERTQRSTVREDNENKKEKKAFSPLIYSR